MNWIESAGGPLIMIEDLLIDYWSGVFSPGQEQSITDYDRAGLIDEYLELIKVGNGEAIILNDEPLPTSHIISPQNNLIIVRWAWANSDDEVIEHLNNLKTKYIKEIAPVIDFKFKSNSISIFDSACNCPEEDNCINLNLIPGIYKIFTKEYKPNKETSLILHEFIKFP